MADDRAQASAGVARPGDGARVVRSRPPLDVLAPEVLDAYVRWGFVDRPDGQVELACTPEDEATIFEVSADEEGARPRGTTSPTLLVRRGRARRRRRRTCPTAWFEAQAERAGAPFVTIDGGHFFLQEDTDRAEALVRGSISTVTDDHESTASSRTRRSASSWRATRWPSTARDLDALVALFVDDVQVGRDRARARRAPRRSSTIAARRRVTILNVGTHVIDFDDDDHAPGSSTAAARSRSAIGGSCRRSSTATRTSAATATGTSCGASTCSGTAARSGRRRSASRRRTGRSTRSAGRAARGVADVGRVLGVGAVGLTLGLERPLPVGCAT